MIYLMYLGLSIFSFSNLSYFMVPAFRPCDGCDWDKKIHSVPSFKDLHSFTQAKIASYLPPRQHQRKRLLHQKELNCVTKRLQSPYHLFYFAIHWIEKSYLTVHWWICNESHSDVWTTDPKVSNWAVPVRFLFSL